MRRKNIAGIGRGGPLKFVAHSRRVIDLALSHGWRPGARYTNLRDVKHTNFYRLGFLDINWKRYDFDKHLSATKVVKPFITVARDIECIRQIDSILNEAEQLQEHASHVVLVPKDPKLNGRFDELLPEQYLLGYSVPTKYGNTPVDIENFSRPVHLLGGRPDRQRSLAEDMPVFSVDCNRFTLDAGFGDYFDGEIFRPHPEGGYENCLRDSIKNINSLWSNYKCSTVEAYEVL